MPSDHAIIVIGASAGGVEALLTLVRRLPPDLPAAVFVTVHFPAHAESALPQILDRASPLPVVTPAENETIHTSRIYVAPPGRHLILSPGMIRLTRGPAENGNRPAIDPMFRSAALAYGPRVIGVVLTGTLDDGTAGLMAIKRRRGIAVVQDPADALFAAMPTSAIEHVAVDHVAPLAEIPALLERLAEERSAERLEEEPMDDANREVEYAAFDLGVIERANEHPGMPSTFGCPDCGGVLWEISDGELVRFRCRVGHAFTGDSLAAAQLSSLEAALWTALRALEESAQLNAQLAKRLGSRGQSRLRDRFHERSSRLREQAELIRELLENTGATTAANTEATRDG